MHMCVCVCVIFLHHSVVLFYSSISLLWYVGYDDFISMSNVFVFVLRIIILLLVLLLAYMKMNILEKSLISISHEFLYFSLFLHFIYFCISSIYMFLINYCFSFFISLSLFHICMIFIFFVVFIFINPYSIFFLCSFFYIFCIAILHVRCAHT